MLWNVEIIHSLQSSKRRFIFKLSLQHLSVSIALRDCRLANFYVGLCPSEQQSASELRIAVPEGLVVVWGSSVSPPCNIGGASPMVMSGQAE